MDSAVADAIYTAAFILITGVGIPLFAGLYNIASAIRESKKDGNDG